MSHRVCVALAASRVLAHQSRVRIHHDSLEDAGGSESYMLAQLHSLNGRSRRVRVAVGAPETSHDPDWFGGFPHAESTFDATGVNRGRGDELGLDGWEPTNANPYATGVVSSDFFHESPSAGSKAAWQTHYPGITSGIGGRSYSPGEWEVGNAGSIVQRYNTPSLRSKGRAPDFFDSAVDQYDGFGRRQLPSALDGKRYSGEGTFLERSVNASLQCETPGCNGTTQLTIFDTNGERAKHCKFSFYVHGTDFDSDKETVDFITVNGHRVKTACWPQSSGCNETFSGYMHPCVNDLPLDSIMDDSGVLVVEAGISKYVDECPYAADGKSYMLSAVPMVTCLVGGKQPAPLFAHNDPSEGLMDSATQVLEQHAKMTDEGMKSENAQVTTIGANGKASAHAHSNGALDESAQITAMMQANQELVDPYGRWHFVQAPAKCPDPGCSVNLVLTMNKSIAEQGGTCLLDVIVNQTDYDQDHDSEEKMWLSVAGEDKTDVTIEGGGQNPCKSKWGGAALDASQMNFTAVTGKDVTALVQEQALFINLGISTFVDDCPSQSFMLDALAQVNCSLPL